MHSESRVYVYRRYMKGCRITVLVEGYHDESRRILNSNSKKK